MTTSLYCRSQTARFAVAPFASICILALLALVRNTGATNDLWPLALQRTNVHRFSVYFEARDEPNYEGTNITEAIAWCKESGVTKVYLESFRNDTSLRRETMAKARDLFREAGFEVAGGISTDQVQSPAETTEVRCFSEPASRDTVKSAFGFAADLFDHVMIDDYLFTECNCTNCFPKVPLSPAQSLLQGLGGTVLDRRGELMLNVSKDLILGAARQTNPDVKVTIKFPKWYDKYHLRGYDVIKQTMLFDQIWVGTETRNYDDCSTAWGGTPQYGGYFLMRWLSRIGGPKTGGGWYDWIMTDPASYIEQARQTILAGARETVLFGYGGLHIPIMTNNCTSPPTYLYPPDNMVALRTNMAELFQVAAEVRARTHAGIAAYKPVNSGPAVTNEMEIFSFIGMLGIPLEPCHVFPTNAPAAFFSTHALKDMHFQNNLETFIDAGKPVLITGGLQHYLKTMRNITAANVFVLDLGPNATNSAPLLKMDAERLNALRAPLLRPLETTFQAPARVALYLFRPNGYVVENFNAGEVTVNLNGEPMTIAGRGWLTHFPSAKQSSYRSQP